MHYLLTELVLLPLVSCTIRYLQVQEENQTKSILIFPNYLTIKLKLTKKLIFYVHNHNMHACKR